MKFWRYLVAEFPEQRCLHASKFFDAKLLLSLPAGRMPIGCRRCHHSIVTVGAATFAPRSQASKTWKKSAEQLQLRSSLKEKASQGRATEESKVIARKSFSVNVAFLLLDNRQPERMLYMFFWLKLVET